MKKWLLLVSLLPTTLLAKPLVLVSYFDPFGKASFNSSEKVAKMVAQKLKNSSAVHIELCALETKFDKAYAQLENCMRDLPQKPDMVVSLGETGCNLKLEMAARNLDHTFGPDNAGVERKNSVILPEANSHLPMTYPLADMYCSLPKKERGNIFVSHNAGSFVCNNTAFQFSHYYSEMTFGFIHVPANNCRDISQLIGSSAERISIMLESAAKTNLEPKKLPLTKEEIAQLRRDSKGDECRSEFYGKARGVELKKKR